VQREGEDEMSDIDYAKKVIQLEAQAVARLAELVNENLVRACDLVANCQGNVIVTGMGKAGIVGRKISATMASTGTPSIFLHPAEAIHGDLGMVGKRDVVLALSNSGETEEINRLIEPIRKIGALLIAMTGNPASTLAGLSDVVLNIGKVEEACPLGLAPSASTTAMLVLGDALALAVAKRRDFSLEDYARYHPGGELGRRLLRVEEIMRTGERNPTVKGKATVREVTLGITRARAGAACVVDDKGRLVGIFTDGDLRRHLAADILDEPVERVMTKGPLTITKGKLASEALRLLRERKFDEIPVVDDTGRLLGLIDVQDLIEVGFA